MLLTRIYVLGNEAYENRNGRHNDLNNYYEEIVSILYQNMRTQEIKERVLHL